MSDTKRNLATPASDAEVEAFLAKVKDAPLAPKGGRGGRLLFAMDATASREPTWDRACSLQAEMFNAAAREGGLTVQLAYFRGFHEFQASTWIDDTAALSRIMTRVYCAGGLTQIERVLRHACAEGAKARIDALVYVGDCVEEDHEALCRRAGELGLHGVPAFIFQEGHDASAEATFREVARLSRGAYCRFDSHSADQLRSLLRAVAVFAAGGRRALRALARHDRELVRQLDHQLD
jgi:hypothetical protein